MTKEKEIIITEKNVRDFIAVLKQDEFFNKNVYKSTWLSGSSTTVYPIEVWCDTWKPCVEIQWGSRKSCEKWVNKIVKSNEILESGRFCKNDGSCPPVVTFYLKGKVVKTA